MAEIKARTILRQSRSVIRLSAGGVAVMMVMLPPAGPSSARVPNIAVGGASTIVGATTTTSGTLAPVPEADRKTFLVASSSSALTVYEEPDAASPSRLLDPATELSGRLVFLVKEQVRGWLEVYLPVRPNGSTAWLHSKDVETFEHGYRIELSLSRHRLTLFDGARLLMAEPIGVGAEDTPTPGGVYYIKELLRPRDSSGFYGPYAYGLSGFSNVLYDYAGGSGVIGLHGTDDASSVGRDVSHGCIRLHNEAITAMVEEIGLPLGTPVIIMA